MGRRLQPTYSLSYQNSKAGTTAATKNAHQNRHHHHLPHPHLHHPHLFKEHHLFKLSNQTLSPNDNKSELGDQSLRKGSSASLRSLQKMQDGSSTTVTTLKDDGKVARGPGRDQRRGIRRVDSLKDGTDAKSAKSKKQSDDISQMMARASNYMTIAQIKLNSFVVCLSYKGKSERNIEDLHDFVFRLPTLEYRNKTWSNLDLALRFKKDVIRALISHTGAIIGNKFSHSRPSKRQQDRLREIAAGNALLPNSDTLVNTPSVSSDAMSLYSVTQNGDDSSRRVSFQSDVDNVPHNKDDAEAASSVSSSALNSGSWSTFNASRRSLPTAQTNGTRMFSPRPMSMHSQQRPKTRDGTNGIDPLGPISPPRSFSGNSGLLPGRSLLKGTLGRHFSGDTVKAKVRFSSGGGKDGADDEKSKDQDNEREKEKSPSTRGGPLDVGGNPNDEEKSKRLNVATLRKKVMNALSGD